MKIDPVRMMMDAENVDRDAARGVPQVAPLIRGDSAVRGTGTRIYALPELRGQRTRLEVHLSDPQPIEYGFATDLKDGSAEFHPVGVTLAHQLALSPNPMQDGGDEMFAVMLDGGTGQVRCFADRMPVTHEPGTHIPVPSIDVDPDLQLTDARQIYQMIQKAVAAESMKATPVETIIDEMENEMMAADTELWEIPSERGLIVDEVQNADEDELGAVDGEGSRVGGERSHGEGDRSSSEDTDFADGEVSDGGEEAESGRSSEN